MRNKLLDLQICERAGKGFISPKTPQNMGLERQVDSGTDWPVRPRMQVVAEQSTGCRALSLRFLGSKLQVVAGTPWQHEKVQALDLTAARVILVES